MNKPSNAFKKVIIKLCAEDYKALHYLALEQKTSVSGVVKNLMDELIEDEADTMDGLEVLQNPKDTTDWDAFKKEYPGICK